VLIIGTLTAQDRVDFIPVVLIPIHDRLDLLDRQGRKVVNDPLKVAIIAPDVAHDAVNRHTGTRDDGVAAAPIRLTNDLDDGWGCQLHGSSSERMKRRPGCMTPDSSGAMQLLSADG
jgi:hypothetical protein